ncbi:hypothetical protein CLAFUW4_05415 [Fulvia fulva]|uniref:Uncharacterized protein n=1 Tax=Passalora fulva TaxID=5499 RepID=A0A9Q8LH23_PASFU|nr:uncharacterized protein CLAFUR5_05562 [Fulvia fulva]KAK4624205.1 hypothetical protein CLAFUR4_05409 [Fulvia fulva]KAK4625891.1 hypothetical protein CLAFUR0_05417 [Fulvia fulva]UJO17245.1 hypothetical protein CLAFUR5_05562 [Fulvia fulva]WPV15016.1 hypothetical protein CLAFUW4_05415 [Fulvia fulva]WPV29670.1 hypothetical protein CLAFUW7_05413 [Fulvia fulva]
MQVPTWSSVCELELSRFNDRDRDLLTPLKQQTPRLTRLSFHELTHTNDERWDNILSVMEARLRLENVKLSGSRCDDVPERMNQLIFSVMSPSREEDDDTGQERPDGAE